MLLTIVSSLSGALEIRSKPASWKCPVGGVGFNRRAAMIVRQNKRRYGLGDPEPNDDRKKEHL
jgi:hypothetical protein